MQPKVLGISGHARSGKSTAAEYLSVQFGARVFTNSKPIGQIVSSLGWSYDRKSYALVSTALFDALGRDILAHHWIRAIDQDLENCLFVIDGIRYLEEICTYRSLTNFHLLAIVSSDEVRFRRTRTAKDSEKDRHISYEKFLKNKESINESNVDKIVLMADVAIENYGSREEYYKHLSSAIKNFVSQ